MEFKTDIDCIVGDIASNVGDIADSVGAGCRSGLVKYVRNHPRNTRKRKGWTISGDVAYCDLSCLVVAKLAFSKQKRL